MLELKRLYDHPDPANPDPATATLKGVRVLGAGAHQNFSPNFLLKGAAQGYLTVGKGLVRIHGEAGDVVYRIDQTPGYYCCHCGRHLEEGSAEGPTQNRLRHVAESHPNTPSPDPGFPAGYSRIHHFACVQVDTPMEG